LRLLRRGLGSIRADLFSYGKRFQAGEAAGKDKHMAAFRVGNEDGPGVGVAVLRDKPELENPAWTWPWKTSELNQRKALVRELVDATLGAGHWPGAAE
jgi:hypothetical protein